MWRNGTIQEKGHQDPSFRHVAFFFSFLCAMSMDRSFSFELCWWVFDIGQLTSLS